MEKVLKSDFDATDRRLMFVMLASPVTWLTHLSITYALAPTACSVGSRLNLHLLTATAIVITLIVGLLSLRMFRAYGEGSTDKGDDRLTRRRFMAMTGVSFAIAFTVAIVATEIPNVVLQRCQ